MGEGKNRKLFKMYTYLNDMVRKKMLVDTIIFISASVYKALKGSTLLYLFHVLFVLGQHLK